MLLAAIAPITPNVAAIFPKVRMIAPLWVCKQQFQIVLGSLKLELEIYLSVRNVFPFRFIQFIHACLLQCGVKFALGNGLRIGRVVY